MYFLACSFSPLCLNCSLLPWETLGDGIGTKQPKGTFSQLVPGTSQVPHSPADNLCSNQGSSFLASKENGPVHDGILLLGGGAVGNLHFVNYRKQKNFQTLKLKPQKEQGDVLGDGDQSRQQPPGFKVTEIFIGRRGEQGQEMASFCGGAGRDLPLTKSFPTIIYRKNQRVAKLVLIFL